MQDRNREHALPHLRTLEQQTLDALLRIEERLITLTAIVHHQGLPVEPTAPLEDAITSVTAPETPLTKTLEKTTSTKGRKGASVPRL